MKPITDWPAWVLATVPLINIFLSQIFGVDVFITLVVYEPLCLVLFYIDRKLIYKTGGKPEKGLFAILIVFLPIGGIPAYLARRANLPGKNRNIFFASIASWVIYLLLEVNQKATNSMLMVVVLIAVAAFYVLPTIIALQRKHPNRWVICTINVIFGGTAIAWIGCLIWAMRTAHISTADTQQGAFGGGGESGLNLFANDEKLIRVVGQSQPPRSISEELNRLSELLDKGRLSEQEFEHLKNKLLQP